MYKVKDLLTNIHKYKSTFQNYCVVFKINMNDYFIGLPNSFSDNQEIHVEFYNYFKRNRPFFELFYTDWHKKKTIRELTFETGISSDKIIQLFNDRKIFANRSLPTIKPSFESENIGFNIDSEFRYYSRYQIIEEVLKCELIERPKPV
jgi:hypothetical protein